MIKTFNEYMCTISEHENFKNLNFEIDDRNYYVYRITDLVENLYYYGSRRCKIDPYDDIGIKYFSSSYDKEFIERQHLYPDNFEYKILKIFKTPGDSVIFESYLHQYFDVKSNDKFINRSNQMPYGFSQYSKSNILRRHDTMSQINPDTGLTGYQTLGINSKISNSKINPDTGLTGYQTTGINSKISNSKINPDTGLTGYQTTGIKNKEKLSKIDDKTGLTIYQLNGIKSNITLSKPRENCISLRDIATAKTKEKLSKIDDKTGLTGYKQIGLKVSTTLNTVQPSGITRAQEIGLKVSTTLNTVQPSGLTKAQEIGLKLSTTLNTVQPSGLTKAQEIGLNSKGVHHYSFKGYYIFKNDKFIDVSKIQKMTKLSCKTIRKYCRNSNNIISKCAYSQSNYLKSIGSSIDIVGKTFKDIGFDYLELSS